MVAIRGQHPKDCEYGPVVKLVVQTIQMDVGALRHVCRNLNVVLTEEAEAWFFDGDPVDRHERVPGL